jgi:hypothetical protein
MIGGHAQKRLDGLEIIEDPAEFAGRLAVRVAGPGGQPPGEDLGWSAQQDDHIEPRMEADLILLAPGDEQHVRVLGGQELSDGVLPPPLAAVRHRLAPAIVGIYGLVPAGSKRLDNTGLPGSRHASQQHPLHGREPTAAELLPVKVRIGVSGATTGTRRSRAGLPVRVRACRIRLIWADAVYTGKLNACAASLKLTICIVARRNPHAFEVLPRPARPGIRVRLGDLGVRSRAGGGVRAGSRGRRRCRRGSAR